MSLQALSLAAMVLQQLTLLSHVGLREGCCTMEVIGDFPEPEARTVFQGLMSNRRETSDAEWASIFEVRHKLLSCHLVWRSCCWSWCRLLHCRSVEAMLVF